MMYCYFKRKEAESKLRLQALMVQLQELKASGEIGNKSLSVDKFSMSPPGGILSVENANVPNAPIVKPVLPPANSKPQSPENTNRRSNSNCGSMSLRPPSMKSEFERMPAGGVVRRVWLNLWMTP
uniref:Uncharacterized protein n=1 Tax=Ditylenchus dipsaci TaxID=166011 RepID=A0A915E740_9BILA